MYDYSPTTCLIKDIDGQIYNIIDLWKGIKKPINPSDLVNSYAIRSSLIRNIDGTDVNVIDTILDVANGTKEGSEVFTEIVKARGRYKTLDRRLIGENKKIYDALNSKDYLPYKGHYISISQSKEGYTKDTRILGKTYQNLIKTSQIIGGNSVGDINIPIKQDTNYVFVAEFEGIDILQFDTALFTCTKIFLTEKPEVGDELYTKTVEGGLGTEYRTASSNVIRTSSKIIINFNTKANEIYLNVRCGGATVPSNAIMKNILLLEGNYIDQYIPSYFEGIKSVAEIEGKIDYQSIGENLCEFVEKGGMIATTDDNFGIDYNDNTYARTNYIDVENFKQVSISSEGVEGLTFNCWYFYDKNKKGIRPIGRGKTVNIPTGIKYCRAEFIYDKPDVTEVLSKFQCKVVEGTINNPNYVPYVEDKRSILLPFEGGLKGLNGPCDTVYERSGEIYIDQYIKTALLNGTEDWLFDESTLKNTVVFYLRPFNNSAFGGSKELGVLCADFKTADVYSGRDEECIRLGRNSSGLYIRVARNRLKEVSVQGWKDYLNTNPKLVYYELENSITHKVLDVNNLDLKTYTHATHLFSTNYISPNIECKVATSPQAVIANINTSNANISNTMDTKMAELEYSDQQLASESINQTATDLEMDFRLFELENIILPTRTTLSTQYSSPYAMMEKCIINNVYDKLDMEYKISRYLEGKRITKEEADYLRSLMK